MSATAAEYFESLASTLPDPVAGTAAYKDIDNLAYQLSKVPYRTARPIKIIVAGAGISGLSFAHEIETGQKIKSADLTIYEKNAGVGGTWYENRYPGCACDIPVHNYQFAWAPYPYFNHYYASSQEIQRYFEDVTDQHNLRKYLKLSHKVVGARWVPEKTKWEVKVQRTSGAELVESRPDEDVDTSFIDECDVFISGTGFVNNWKWPAIPGRLDYQGEIFHSAIWPKDHTFQKDQTVALIGNGSTGIQILPAILDQVKKVYVYIRNPTWITAGFAQKYAGPNGTNITFTEEQKQHWADHPDEYYAYRVAVESELNNRFRIYLKDSEEQEQARQFSVKQISDKLVGRPDLAEYLLPDFAVGCRRPTPGVGYIEALCSDKVEVVWGEIDSFTKTGLRSASGREVDLDAIICATGFDVAFAPRFPTIGLNNVNLQDQWSENPQSYLSVTAANMPNYFVYLGPASAIGHGSLISSIELATSYIADLLGKMQTQNYGSLVPKTEVVEAWQQHCLAWLEKSAWSTACISTYKNGKKDGKLVSLHGGSRLHYFELLQTPRYEDFEWTSLCPDPSLRFAWLASGFTVGESNRYQATKKGVEQEDENLTWFLQPAPKSAFIKRREMVNGAVKGAVNGAANGPIEGVEEGVVNEHTNGVVNGT